MKNKEIELEEGQIWQKPNTLDVRTIHYVGLQTTYFDIGGTKMVIYTDSFRRWIGRNSHAHQKHNVKLIGHYDFEKEKVRVAR